jgi:transcriptional regulator with XRE-family HTH domain
MALFFDAAWFDEKLSERGLDRAVLAAVGGLSEAELAEVFKDQRELSAGQVAAFAELLGVTPAEVARHAGVSTPVPGEDATARIAALERRVAALEAEVQALRKIQPSTAHPGESRDPS